MTDPLDRRGASFLGFALTLFFLALVASAQEEEGERRVRIVKAHANVHMGPTTARPVLVLAPKDAVLRVVGRRGEWLEVELTPELRETGMVMRWYKNEERGFVHESTVETVAEKPEAR